MFDPLRRVLVRHVSDAFRSQSFLARYWKLFGFTAMPDYHKACADYDLFIDTLSSKGARVEFLRNSNSESLDSIYVHDPAETIGDGMVLCRMGKNLRRNESSDIEDFCKENQIPILGNIMAPGILEAGDIIWLDETTLAVGEGYRSNRDGIDQLAGLSRPIVERIVRVPLPHWQGKTEVLHLMSLISPIARNVAVVYRPLLPVPFLKELEQRGYLLIDVPVNEFDSLGCNVLALSSKCCLMADGNPVTLRRIEKAGVEVLVYPAEEISLKGQGGPTCLTRPLLRSDDEEAALQAVSVNRHR